MTLSISPILPLQREVQWSDLLAVLIETDPAPAAAPATGDVTVRREEARGGVRADLVLYHADTEQVVVEVKVLSDVGQDQLAGLREQFSAPRRVLIHPSRLGVNVADEPDWQVVTWEEVLIRFADSADPWVARTASAWLEHLEAAIQPVGAATRWDDTTGTDFAGALRARMTWIHDRMQPPASVTKDILGGRSPVVRVYIETPKPGYTLMAEAQERLPVQSFPRRGTETSVRPLGPAVRVTLVQGLQENVSTSRHFDWGYLHALWRRMEPRRDDWIEAQRRPKAECDRAGLARIEADGAPRHLGQGFGDAWARQVGVCQFGPRFQLTPDSTLEDIVGAMDDTALLVDELSSIDPPTPTG